MSARGLCFGKPLELLAQRAQGIGFETISRLMLLLLRAELKIRSRRQGSRFA
jgi:hypothetical protein